MNIALIGSILARRLFSVLFVLTLAGCATNESQPQPAGRAVWPDPPPEGQSLLFFYTQRRDSLRNQPTIFVDNVKVFTLRGDAYSWCYVKTGVHDVRAIWEPYDPQMNVQARYLFTPGATIYLRLTTNTWSNRRARTVSGQMHPMDGTIAKLDAEQSTYVAPIVTQVGMQSQ